MKKYTTVVDSKPRGDKKRRIIKIHFQKTGAQLAPGQFVPAPGIDRYQ